MTAPWPYLGQPIRGRIVRTVMRGHTVYAEGDFAPIPHGKFIGQSE